MILFFYFYICHVYDYDHATGLTVGYGFIPYKDFSNRRSLTINE